MDKEEKIIKFKNGSEIRFLCCSDVFKSLDNRVYFLVDYKPGKWPKARSVWVGHRVIAKLIMRVIRWLNKKKR